MIWKALKNCELVLQKEFEMIDICILINIFLLKTYDRIFLYDLLWFLNFGFYLLDKIFNLIYWNSEFEFKTIF